MGQENCERQKLVIADVLQGQSVDTADSLFPVSV